MTIDDETRTRLETLAGRLVDAEGAITSAQETLSRVLNVVAASVVDAQSAAAEPEAGEWVTVRPGDERITFEARVRLAGVEGYAVHFQRRLTACGPVREVWSADHRDGPDVELWVPAEVTLPLPTEPGPFWGSVEHDGETYVGWVLHAPGVHFVNAYCTPLWFGRFWHHAKDITRLPLPDSEREALR